MLFNTMKYYTLFVVSSFVDRILVPESNLLIGLIGDNEPLLESESLLDSYLFKNIIFFFCLTSNKQFTFHLWC